MNENISKALTFRCYCPLENRQENTCFIWTADSGNLHCLLPKRDLVILHLIALNTTVPNQDNEHILEIEVKFPQSMNAW